MIFDLHLLVPEIMAQIFNPTAELAIPTETPTNEVNSEIETQPLTAETKTKKKKKEKNAQSNINQYTLVSYTFLFHLFF